MADAVLTEGTTSVSSFDLRFSPPQVTSDRLFQDCASASQKSVLQISDAVFTVKTRNGEKNILQGVSLAAKSGEVLAMMGPSGAGKTTLLEYMTLSLKGGSVKGDIRLNNVDLTSRVFQQQAAYVEQYDQHWAFLTCREVMTYSAALYLAKGTEERLEHVNNLMTHLGLVECGNTKCGNDMFKGLSGGQKKRLALGIAMLKGPSLLFLDEPTSGLDAAAAASVMGYVHQMATQAQMIVVATIHQPSTALFMSFTKVLFLANGRVAYHGAPDRVKEHCRSIGSSVPEDTNPADHFMQLINSEFVTREEVDEVVAQWVAAPDRILDALKPLSCSKRPGTMFASWTLLMRHLQLSIRDPTLFVGRMVMFMISNSFFSLVYWNARPQTQETVIPKYWLAGWMVAVPTLFSMIAVYNANEDFRIIRREHKNGMIPLASYLIAVFLLQLPYMVLLSLSALVIPYYGLAAANTLQMLPQIALVSVVLWSFEQSSLFFGVCFDNPLLGMLGSIALWFANFLLSGTFLKPSFINWPLKLCTYVFPLRWAFLQMSYFNYHGTIWDGAESLADGKFSCGGGGSFAPCYGRTGDQVLTTLGHLFPVGQPGTMVQEFGYIFLYGLAFKVLHVVLVLVKTRFGVRSTEKSATDKSASEESPEQELNP